MKDFKGTEIASIVINSVIITVFFLTGLMKLVKGPTFAWADLKDENSRAAFFFCFSALLILSTVLANI